MLRPLNQTQRLVDLLIAGGFVFAFGLLTLQTRSVAESALALLAVLALGGALALRRWSPPLALTLAWIAAVVQIIGSEGATLFDAAIPVVVYSCAAYGTRGVRWAAFVSSLVGAVLAGLVETTRFAIFLEDAAPTFLRTALGSFLPVALLTGATLLLAWTLGVLVATAQRSRQNRLEADEAGRQVIAEQERTRIARDMHDVVAHSLAVVIAQSDGARLLRGTDPDAVDEALGTIGAVSRAALADVRVLLQQLRYEGTTAVQPGLRDLDALGARFERSGLQVQVSRDDGLETLGAAVQLAAYRIVQEALTNALRHGDLTRPASVVLARTPHGLEAEVVNGIDPARPPSRSSAGHGLVGMRERAGAVEGELRAGPEGDRFRVHAFLPGGATAAMPVVPVGEVR